MSATKLAGALLWVQLSVVVACSRSSPTGPAVARATMPTEAAPSAGESAAADAGPPSAISGVSDADLGTAADASTQVPPLLEASMTAHLFADHDFRAFVCGNDACALADFGVRLDYELLALKDGPRVTGYLVGLASDTAPPNGYLAVFLVQGEAAVAQFVYYGASLEVEDGRRDQGYRRIKGQERVSVTEWHEDEYAWNGSRYVLVRAAVHGQPLWKAE